MILELLSLLWTSSPWVPAPFAPSFLLSETKSNWVLIEVHGPGVDSLVLGRNPALVRRQDAKTAPGDRLVLKGSKTVRIGFGDEGTAIDQTLNLRLDGEISPGVLVEARLTDNQVPLSPEGSSASLREIDAVYLAVRAKRWESRLGDQLWKMPEFVLPGLERRIRGLSAAGGLPEITASAVAGAPQARWTRGRIAGVEGRQEGYPIPDAEGNSGGSVVPGSDKVYLNGQILRRGSDADYTIRSFEGLLDFTPKRRILAGDRIEVEYQATERPFESALAAGQVVGQSKVWRYAGFALREGDNSRRPLSFAADSANWAILERAGADPRKAADSLGHPLALPRSTAIAGAGLALGQTNQSLQLEVRGTSTDRNTISSQDPQQQGALAAVEGQIKLGQPLRDGGLGILSLGLNAGGRSGVLSLETPSTSSLAPGTWNEPLNRPGLGRFDADRWGTLSTSWEARPGMGAWSEWAAREDSTTRSWRTALRTGLDTADGQGALAGFEWARRSEPTRDFDRQRVSAGGKAVWGNVTPRMGASWQRRDASATSDRSEFKNDLAAGLGWHDQASVFQGNLDGNWQSQGAGGQRQITGTDTLRALGFTTTSRWISDGWSGDGTIDWRNSKRRSSPSLPWVQDQSWLGQANALADPFPGLSATAKWRLSATAFQPEIPAWDTVPAGLGTHKQDPVTGEILPADDGNLRAAGTRLDTSRTPVQAASRSLSGELELVPAKIWPAIGGLLADLGGQVRAEWEQRDSTHATQIFPDFDESVLRRSLEARSEWALELWWQHKEHRIEGRGEKSLEILASSSLASRPDYERHLFWTALWIWNSSDALRWSTEGRRSYRTRASAGIPRAEEAWWGQFSASWTKGTIQVVPSILGQTGTGTGGSLARGASFWSPALNVRGTAFKRASLRSELRVAYCQSDGEPGPFLGGGWSQGRTLRLTAGMDWALRTGASAGFEWLLRQDPTGPLFQKLQAEARAEF